MVKAGVIAQELRRIADALDREPETKLEQPMLSFYCNDFYAKDKGKSSFLSAVRLFPKPLNKKTDESTYEVEHGNRDDTCGVWLRAVIDRNNVCTLIEPAKPAVYDCPPLLS